MKKKTEAAKVTVVGGKTLKVRFTQCGSKVYAEILEQDESLRGGGTKIRRDGYSIASISCPAVVFGTLYIRGFYNEQDRQKICYDFGDSALAKNYIEKISELVKILNGECCFNKIVIESDGKKTTAVLYDKKEEELKRSCARCSPEDEFSLEAGATIALHRLFDHEPKSSWNAVVVCVRTNDERAFTKGRIYKVKDGFITNELDEKNGNYTSVDEMNSLLRTAKFIEIVK